MARSPLTPHDRHAVLVVGRRVAADLAAAALDPASGLSVPVRAALAALVLAVDLEAHRIAGVEPPAPELRETLRRALSDPHAPRAPP